MQRQWLVVFLAVALLVCSAPARGRAAPPTGAHAVAAPSGEGGQAEEPEKMDIFKGTLDLAIWTVVVFLLLLFILTRFAWKPLLEALQKREESIRAAVEEAQRARDEAQRLRTELQQEMARSEAKVQQMIEEGRRNAQRAADEVIAKAKAEVQAERERLRREIDTARDQALQEIWNQAAQLASHIAGKALGRMLTPDDQRRLVEEAVTELPRRNGHA